jgi:hypothetical protein
MVETQTYDGAPLGSILSVTAHEIPDDGARYIQDGFVHESGITTRRGVIQPVPFVTHFPDAASGLVQATQPNGISRVAAIHGTSSPKLGVMSEDYLTFADVTLPGVLSTAPYHIVDAKPAIDGGAWIGLSSQVDPGASDQHLIYWRGADKADYTTGTAAITAGSKTVTGTGTVWTLNVVPGMFLFDHNGMYQGVVKQVVSDTSLTLVDPALLTFSANTYTLKSIRPFVRKVTKGLITTDGTTTVVGAATKFKDQSLDSGTWHIFRASDSTRVGQVASVQSNNGLTLSAASAVTMTEEHYFAIKQESNTSWPPPVDPGFLTAAYAQMQFYAVGTTLRFSDPTDPEAVDFDPNAGDFIPVASTAPGAQNTPMVALVPAFNSLLVLKTNEEFALAGTTPTNFELHKLNDGGCISSMSVQQYQGNVLYAGREGIYLYDGVQTNNLVADRLGNFYKSLVRNFDPTTHRMWSVLDSDHYMLHIESVESTYKVFRGQSGVAPTRMTISIYLPNRAVTFLTNLDIRGSITLPAQSGRGTWYLINGMENHPGRPSAPNTTDAGAGGAFAAGTYSFAVTYTTADGEFALGNASLPLTVGLNHSINVTDIPAAPAGVITRTLYLSYNGGAFQKITDAAAVAILGAGGTSMTFSNLTGSLAGPPPSADPVKSYICRARDLFEIDGPTDTLTCAGNTRGPDFYFESKRYTLGDALLKKLWKLLLLTYYAGGDDLKFETLTGLNDEGTVSANNWLKTILTWSTTPAVAVTWDALKGRFTTWDELAAPRFVEKRRRFTKRHQLFGFRIYQNSNQVTTVRLGSWSIGFKPLRKGRV